MVCELTVPTSLYLSTSSHLSVSEMGCLPFSLPYSGSLPPALLGYPYQSFHIFFIFFLPLPIVWFKSPQHVLQKTCKTKISLSPQTPKSLADLFAYTDFLLKLPSKIFWMFILTGFYVSGEKQSESTQCFPQACNILGCQRQPLSLNDSFFIVFYICLCSLFLLLSPPPWSRSLSPQTWDIVQTFNQSFQFETMYK